MPIKRNLNEKLNHFKHKLLFISGPRQSGKTYLVLHALKPAWTLNMDIASERLLFKKFPQAALDWLAVHNNQGMEKPLIFVDEIHKVKGWRNIIKGTFDKMLNMVDCVASGSSAFEIRRQDKGDSLAGRAVWLTLFPVSFREYVTSFETEFTLGTPWRCEGSLIERVKNIMPHQNKLRQHWDRYILFGSFPENLDKQDDVFYEQWLNDYMTALLDRDLRDLNTAKDAERVYQVFELLLEGLGSTYSLKSLSENLAVSPNTIKSDVCALRQVLLGFELPVVGVSKAKQIRKEKKFYPIDFCFARKLKDANPGAFFESVVACLLMRSLHDLTAKINSAYQFGFYRDYNKREVDFVVRSKKNVIAAIECKTREKAEHGNLSYFHRTFKPQESICVVAEPGIFKKEGDVFVVSVELFAACLM
ncbi:MAG: ATP-binding protein [Deltaproteobacteria bacterium]|nr:ATP-binding protein [Deltaproteobacteria bacterium]